MQEDYKAAYETILRENTNLHARLRETTQIAERRIQQADQIIKELHDAMDATVPGVIEIFRHYFGDEDSFAKAEIRALTIRPLRISADGLQKKGTPS